MSEGTNQQSERSREIVVLIRPRLLLAPTTLEITCTQDIECNEPGHLLLGTRLPWAAFAVRGFHVPATTDEVFELFRTRCDEVAGVEYCPLKAIGTVSFVDCLPFTVGEVLELGGGQVVRAEDDQDLFDKPPEQAIEEFEYDPS